MDRSGRRLQRISVRLLRFLKAGYPDWMPAAADSHGGYHHRIYDGRIPRLRTPRIYLAEVRTAIPAPGMARKRAFYDSRLPLPYAQAVLWSSFFVTLVAKKYRFMQFELDMVFDTR